MSSQLKPIKMWSQAGPNPPKVAIMLEELGLPYEIETVAAADLKKPAYLAVNPNGRVPAIYDPNADLTIWESGAIIEYLVERYDIDHKLSFGPGTKDAYHAKQWLFFQVSGQGPYYGQVSWFKKYHHEPLPSAVERYIKEIKRVTGVLEDFLSKQSTGAEGPWLVGGKVSYADLAFVPWQFTASRMEEYDAEDFPVVTKWLAAMQERPSVKKVTAAVYAARQQQIEDAKQ